MEVLLTSDQYPDSKTSLNLWNPYTGTKLLSLRGPPAVPASLVLIRDEGFAIVEQNKPFIHFWQVGHTLQTSRRILCPGRPGPMAMTPDGNFLAVAIDEKINIWQPATGRIVCVVNSAHYRPVTVLKFTDDGTFLLSGGQDGMVLAWNFQTLVSGAESKPMYSWSNHSLPVTGIHVGTGGRKATVFTVGEDRFLKVYSLMTGTLLLSVAFPLPLTAVVVDAGEKGVFVGGVDGGIYQLNIGAPPRSLEHHVSNDAGAEFVYRKHSERITGLAISVDGKHLASADTVGTVYIWNLDSKQAIRTVMGGPGSVTKGKVTNVAFWLGNPDSLKGGRKPSIVFPDVPKLIESNDDDRHERNLVMSVFNRVDQPHSMMEMDLEGFTSSNKRTHGSTAGGNVEKLNDLKVRLAKSEEINRKLHEFCVENIMYGGGGDEEVQDEVSGSKKPKRV